MRALGGDCTPLGGYRGASARPEDRGTAPGPTPTTDPKEHRHAAHLLPASDAGSELRVIRTDGTGMRAIAALGVDPDWQRR